MSRSFSQVELASISAPDVTQYGADYESYCKHYLLYLQVGSATGRELNKVKRVRSKRTTAYWFKPNFDVTNALKSIGVVFHDTVTTVKESIPNLTRQDEFATPDEEKQPIVMFDCSGRDEPCSSTLIDNTHDHEPVVIPDQVEPEPVNSDLVTFAGLTKNEIFRYFAEHGVGARAFRDNWETNSDLRAGNPFYVDTICSIIAWKAMAKDDEEVPDYIQRKVDAWDSIKNDCTYAKEIDSQMG